ncbi:MAG TPA: alpha/beta-hydrolase family protein [Kineosporiaceae bacterium]
MSQLAGGHASEDGEYPAAGVAVRDERGAGQVRWGADAVRGQLAPSVQAISQRAVAARPSRGGVVVGLLFFCISLTPSLLPRTWLAQSLISAVTSTAGYAIGVALGWLAVRVVPRRWFPARPVRRLLVRSSITAAVLLVAVSLYAGSVWQRDIFELMAQRPPGRWTYLRVPGVTLVLVTALVAVTRLVRRGVLRVVALIRRSLPAGPQEVLGVTAGLLVLVGVTEGVALGGFLQAANRISAAVNDAQDAHLRPPASAMRSGSPVSLVSFASLGREGRTFVSGGPDAAALRRFAASGATDLASAQRAQAQVKEPIRVYVGLRADGDSAASAQLAVRELERTGAFGRSVLCVVTTTGTGWVDPYLAAALEYMHHGDTAIVGMQYSFLPSWISFLSERDRVAVAGPELFDAVHARWEQLPPAHRPKLLVFAESLGSLGSEAGFRGLDDVLATTDGVLWSGPTNANPLWSRLERDRDRPSPQVLPVYHGGSSVRFVSRSEDLDAAPASWSYPRVVYLQNATDPVTWWSPRLLWEEPDWLRERAGRDVLPAMRWYPVVTFLQVTADLALAYGAPPGHGHQFHTAAVAAWAAIDAPAGWTASDTARLTALLGP